MKLLSLARDLQRRKARERQSLFVAEGVRLPAACVFESEEAVERFQREAGWRAEVMDGQTVELPEREEEPSEEVVEQFKEFIDTVNPEDFAS